MMVFETDGGLLPPQSRGKRGEGNGRHDGDNELFHGERRGHPVRFDRVVYGFLEPRF